MGASFKSQEFFKLSESYTNILEANWEDRAQTGAESPESLNEYKMRSPYTIGFSLGAAKKKLGAINFDVDLVDYRALQFSSMPAFPVDFTDLNNELSSTFKTEVQFPIGNRKTHWPLCFKSWICF